MYTLQNIKDTYYSDLAFGLTERGFDEYLRENYVPVYSISLDLLGYERK
jgi:hypothetical protein